MGKSVRVGFIGLGLMGEPMAKNILKNGFDLTVYNRTASKTKASKKLGAKVASNPADVARISDIVITMVTGPADVSQVIFGKKGIATGAKKGLIVIDMSTIGPLSAVEIADKLKVRGIDFLDAPVTGSVLKATSGELTIFIGGKLKTFQKAKPVLQAMGKTLHYMGISGKGQAIKLINNLLVGETITALAEAMRLADYLGLKRAKVADILSEVPAASFFMKLKMPNMVKNKFPTAFSLSNMRKDLSLALKEIDKKKGELPILTLVDKLYKKGISLGLGQEDLSAIIKVSSR